MLAAKPRRAPAYFPRASYALLGQAAVQGSMKVGGKMLIPSGAMRLVSYRGVPSARGGRPGQALGLAR